MEYFLGTLDALLDNINNSLVKYLEGSVRHLIFRPFLDILKWKIPILKIFSRY